MPDTLTERLARLDEQIFVHRCLADAADARGHEGERRFHADMTDELLDKRLTATKGQP